MQSQILWNQGWIIASHALVAMLALVLGAVQLIRRKGGLAHQTLGRVWVACMAFVALGSFWIHEIRLLGEFSPIHLLSVFTLLSLFYSIVAARQGRINAHRKSMRGLYVGGLVLAGLFTLSPGRVLHRMFFG